jgi:hypothetical protein
MTSNRRFQALNTHIYPITAESSAGSGIPTRALFRGGPEVSCIGFGVRGFLSLFC